MRLRARHFACLLLLLSSLGAAEATVHGRTLSPGGRYIASVLQQAAQREAADTTLSFAEPHTAADLSVAELPARSAWTMLPPAAHAAAIHSFTAVPATRL